MSFARRVDTNHRAIIEALEQLGWLCHSTAALPGWVDVTAYRHTHGICLFEIKRNAKAKLKPSQSALLAKGWKIERLDSVEDAIAFTVGPKGGKSQTY